MRYSSIDKDDKMRLTVALKMGTNRNLREHILVIIPKNIPQLRHEVIVVNFVIVVWKYKFIRKESRRLSVGIL